MTTNKIEYKIPNTHSKVVLEVCNLFEQEGLRVVHCHNTFDTDDEVMLGTSVMGQFIKYCKDKGFALDDKITEWIEKNKKKAATDDSLPCRKEFFNIGVLCPLNVDGENFVLAAFDDLRQFLDTGAMDMDSYVCFLDHLWESLGRLSAEKSVVNIPAFGNKIVNVATNGFTIGQKVGLIIHSYFKALKKKRLFETLHICIHETDAENLDLDKWLSTLLPYLFQFSQLPLGLKTLNSRQKGLFAGIEKTVISYDKLRLCCQTNEIKKVFISHAKEDVSEADAVYDYLEKQGFKCWMDTHDITPGIAYAKEIMKGFKNSDAVVVVISKNTMGSIGVQNEIDNVYKRNKTIIPFRIDDTELSDELSFYLSSTQWINAFPNFEDHLDDLGRALRLLLS